VIQLPINRLILILTIGLIGCAAETDEGGRVIASAFDEKLYWTDLRSVVPLDATLEDSIAIANSFVNSWLRNQTILAKAKENLAETDLDIERKINDYRNSLLIYTYERRLVDQKLDTLVSEDELRVYYDSNNADFKLKEDVARLRWIRFNTNELPKSERRMIALMCNEDPEKKSEFERIIAENDAEVKDYTDQWVRWLDVSQEIPLVESDRERVGERACWVINKEDVRYFVHLLEHRANATSAPFELVRKEIRAIILNQRKALLLEDARVRLFEQARKTGQVKIHD
jgi:hypothetical protein